jgi:large subunit ribosomal protein L9
MKREVLLLEDVHALGRSGDVVLVKLGYARNCLVPQKKAVIASKHTLRMQKKLQADRLKKAAEDKKQSEEIAQKLQGSTFAIIVKVDPDGHLYGSVSAQNIAHLLTEKGYAIDKKYIQLPKPIKKLGSHSVSLELPEDVFAKIILDVQPDIPLSDTTKSLGYEPSEIAQEQQQETEQQAEDATQQ